jgi:hypothetical protein
MDQLFRSPLIFFIQRYLVYAKVFFGGGDALRRCQSVNQSLEAENAIAAFI